MSATNIELVKRWFEEVWNKGSASAIDELLGPDARVHGVGPAPLTNDEFKAFQVSYRNAFPDIRITLDETIASGDIVAGRWTATGTHRGDGLGIAASGKTVRFEGMSFIRVDGDKLVEGWNAYDRLGMLQQCGAVPMS